MTKPTGNPRGRPSPFGPVGTPIERRSIRLPPALWAKLDAMGGSASMAIARLLTPPEHDERNPPPPTDEDWR